MTRYILIGAGAIGGSLGGRLTQAGEKVVLVARGEHLEVLRRRGLRLRSVDGDETVQVRAIGGPEEIELVDEDVLVLATKTQQATEALAQWADAPVRSGAAVIGTAGERLPMLTALNGVAGEQLALRYFARVYGVCVWMPTVHLQPGEVLIAGTPIAGMLHIGRVPAALTDEADRRLLAQVQETWPRAGVAVRLPADVMSWKYRKLISNLANAFEALTGPSADLSRLVAAANGEARQVLDAAGIAYTSDAEEQAAREQSFSKSSVPGTPTDLGGSTWQSLSRGTGNVESDYLNGEISLIAHRLGQSAPINAGVAALARRAAARGQRPGSISVDELSRLLGL
ncbi:MAG TPA: 2-dehydropantoate 2-reductase N-terminal domain-containing protein [Propionibacteriaceae bacterium]|nr:2-dehydropantoate 2-reductase N-terminal domain-containing protein [Propionibacteriaceae bacterium]